MNIPDKAVLAMIEQLGLTPDEIDEAHVQALEAAAPFIAAQALRDEASRLRRVDGHDWYVHDRHARNALTAHADEVEQ